MSGQRKPLGVLLVHGTWSTIKIWDELCETLKREIREIPTEAIQTIPWNGRNSWSGRKKGAEDFRRVAENYERIVAITHSHGVNVLLNAREVHSRVTQVIALNGPMLSTHTYETDQAVRFYAASILFAILLISVAIIIIPAVRLGDIRLAALFVATVVAILSILTWIVYELMQTRAALLLIPVGIVVLVVGGPPGMQFLRIAFGGADASHLIDSLSKFQQFMTLWFAIFVVLTPWLVIASLIASQRLRRQMKEEAGTPHDFPPLLSIVKKNDEIMLILGIAMAFQRVIELPLSVVSRWLGHTLAAVAVSSALYALLIDEGIIRPVAPLGSIISNALIGVSAIVICFALAMVAKLLLFGGAYGWEMAGLAFDHSIYISSGLANRDVTVFVVPPKESKFEIAHGEIYKDEVVHEKICKVLRSLIAS